MPSCASSPGTDECAPPTLSTLGAATTSVTAASELFALTASPGSEIVAWKDCQPFAAAV